MLDEREVEVPAGERAVAFNNKTVWQRIAIVAAGPAANLILCIALLWAMFVIGRQDYSATIGRTTGMAAQAGFVAGDRILAVEDRSVDTWAEASMAFTTAAMDRQDAHVRVRDSLDNERTRVLPLSQLPAGFDERQVPVQAGFIWQFWLQPAQIDSVSADSAATGLLQPGDLILAVDGQRVDSADQVTPLIQQLGQRGGPGMVEVERNGERLALELTPQAGQGPDGKPRWLIGVGFATNQAPAYDARQQYGVFAALPAAVRETLSLIHI